MKVFLGYGSESEKIAHEVYEFLKTLVDDVWFDKVSLVGASDWDRARSQGQTEADMIVHLCSAEMLNRKGVVHREIRQTLKLLEDQPFGANFALFIRLTNVRLPIELMRLQYIDYFLPDWRERVRTAISARRAQIEATASDAAVDRVSRSTSDGYESLTVEDITDEYDARHHLIAYPLDGLYWRYINASISEVVLSSHFSAHRNFSGMTHPEWVTTKAENSIKTEEFFRNSEIVSIRFHHHVYYPGAAHGMHGVSTKNFLGPKLGEVPIGYLFSHNKQVAMKMMECCERNILATHKGVDSSILYLGDPPDDSSLWTFLEKYNVDASGITITFNPYEILPFSFGTPEVLVPWHLIEGDLDEKVADLPQRVSR